MKKKTTWPVLQRFDQNHLERIALPIGGIGTGTISMGGRGDLRDWEVVNRPAKGFVPEGQGITPFFSLYARDAKGKKVARLLEGPLETTDYEGQLGAVARNHGFPRFRHAEFKAAYPFGQVLLSDPAMPVRVTLKAFNPMIPGDADASAYPAAVFRVEIQNRTKGRLDTSVALSVPNFIGEDGTQAPKADVGVMRYRSGKGNRNKLVKGKKLVGLHLTSPEMPKEMEQYGDLFLSTVAGQDISYRTSWADLSWGDSKLEFWDDFSVDGRLENQTSEEDKPVASLCVSTKLAAGQTKELTFILSWRFPNRPTWTRFENETVMVGNHYATRFPDAVDAAEKLYASLDALERKTQTFVESLCRTTLPETVLQAALFNLSTLRTQTCFRTPDGRFYGWEGCFDKAGCCPGSCNHVWNYEHATAFLYGGLSATMREVEFLFATNDVGRMKFRVDLPLDREPKMACCKNVAAADGQMGCIMKLYRDWQLSGDDAMLRALYPQARKALEFCWIPGGWDADRDGLMEGCQHNTMDVEYYGPNPQMGFWYLGALRAMQEMAAYMGDDEFAGVCRSIFEAGAKATDARLFNGEFYEQVIEAPRDAAAIAKDLRLDMGAKDLSNPVLQLGAGCLVDQLVGQYTAHILGLGYLSDKKRQRTALARTFKYNFKQGFHDHFNHFRSFVLGDESGVLMATYPLGRRPARPFPYFNEVMTGFEYCLAVHLLYEGMEKEGLAIIDAIRDRYDGKKRSPFDEAECGHHYARAMAAWSALLALTGFQYSGVEKRMAFKAANGSFFWSNGYAWGLCTIKKGQVALEVQHGALELKAFELVGLGVKKWPRVQRIKENGCLRFTVDA